MTPSSKCGSLVGGGAYPDESSFFVSWRLCLDLLLTTILFLQRSCLRNPLKTLVWQHYSHSFLIFPQRNKRTNPTFLGSKLEVLPGLFEPTSYSRYLTVKFDNQRAEDSDMFKICREITTICGREPKMFRNDGSVLIEVVTRGG